MGDALIARQVLLCQSIAIFSLLVQTSVTFPESFYVFQHNMLSKKTSSLSEFEIAVCYDKVQKKNNLCDHLPWSDHDLFHHSSFSMRTLSSSYKKTSDRMPHPRALLFVHAVPGHQFLPLLLAVLEDLIVQSFPGVPDFHHDHHAHPARVSLGYQACHVLRDDTRSRRKVALNKAKLIYKSN